jgi:hypothetical protein
MRKSRYGLPWIEPEKVGRPRWTQFNPVIAGQAEEIYEPLRDYSATAAGQALALQILFSTPIGQQYTPVGATTGFQKTRYHTNLKKQGELPNPQKFQVEGIFAQIHPSTTPADAKAFLTQVLNTFTIGSEDKRYIEAQPFLLGGGSSVHVTGSMFQATAADSFQLAVANGWEMTKNIHVLGEDVDSGAQIIEQGQSFQLLEDPTQDTGDAAYTTNATTTKPPGTGVRMFYYLPGHWLRGVQ